jgi:hypothetical protein
MVPFGHEIAIRAVATALAGLSVAFAGYMIAHGGGRIRVNGIEHLAIFAQPRGSPAAVNALVLPSLSDPEKPLDLTATGSLNAGFRPAPSPVEIVGARADRVWLKIDGAIRGAAPGDGAARRTYRLDRSARRGVGFAGRSWRDAPGGNEKGKRRGDVHSRADF